MLSNSQKFEMLQKTSVLWALFAASIVLIALSEWMKTQWQLQLIDGIWSPGDARALIAQLSAEQKTGHLWFTSTVDVLLPIFVAVTLAGITLKAFPHYGKYLAIPPLLAVPFDYTEGVIQVLVLTDTLDLLAIKAYTSPVKISGYLFGLAMLSLALVKWLLLRIKALLAG
jgi:hypothetical protein